MTESAEVDADGFACLCIYKVFKAKRVTFVFKYPDNSIDSTKPCRTCVYSVENVFILERGWTRDLPIISFSSFDQTIIKVNLLQ